MGEEHTLTKSYRQYIIVAVVGAAGSAASVYYLIRGNNLAAAFLGIPGIGMLIGGAKKAWNTKTAIDATSKLTDKKIYWPAVDSSPKKSMMIAPALLTMGTAGAQKKRVP